MTLTVQIKVPQSEITQNTHEAEIKCSTDGYKHAVVLAPGDEMTVHVHAANVVRISEVPAGTKAARLAAASKAAPLPYQQRVLDEKQDLDIRITKLDEFMLGDAFKSLLAEERDSMKRQLDAMHGYSSILAERIGRF